MSVYRPTYKHPSGEIRESPTWWVQFWDHRGVRQRVRGYSDKTATNALENRLMQLVHVRASGATPTADLRRWCMTLPPHLTKTLVACDLLDRRLVAGNTPIAEHVQAWEEHLRAKGTGERQREQVAARVRAVIAGCNFKTLLDVSVGAVEKYLRARRENGAASGKDQKLSVRTANFYVQAIRQFVGWAYRTEVLSEDPLRGLGTQGNAAKDPKRVRRALTLDEQRMLFATTAAGPDRDGMSGAERSLLYRVACETGLRKNEARTLTVADLVLDGEDPAVCVRAVNAKNGRDARQQISPELAADLKAFLDGQNATARVFATPDHWRACETLEADLLASEIKVRDDLGRVVDFHALRKTFGTNLARAGVGLQMAQKLMRHSDPALTANIYTEFADDDKRAAVNSLRSFLTRPEASAEDSQSNSHGREPTESTPSDVTAYAAKSKCVPADGRSRRVPKPGVGSSSLPGDTSRNPLSL